MQNTFAYLSIMHRAEIRHFKPSIVCTPFIHCVQVLVARGWVGTVNGKRERTRRKKRGKELKVKSETSGIHALYHSCSRKNISGPD